MNINSRDIMSFFEKIAKIWLQQLPLFIMLVIYTTAPTYSYGWYSYKTYLMFVLPQVILPSMVLCLVAACRRWVWWFVFVFANFLWLIEIGCYFCQHQRMWSYIAIIIAQSNPRETIEFVSIIYGNLLKALLVMMISAFLFYICDRYWHKKNKNIIRILQINKRNIIMRCAGFIIVMSTIYSPYTIYRIAIWSKDYNHRLRLPKRLNLACTWITYGYALNDVFNNPNLNSLPHLVETLSNTEVILDEPTDSLTVIYVIGESFSRNRSSLYGYPYDTNPLMTKELTDSSLIIFDNVISRWHVTYEVYRTMLSTYNIQDDKSFESYPLLPALMKKAGYKVSYLDNQQSIANGVGDVHCTYFLNDYTVRDSCIDMYNDDIEEYDADFVNKYVSPYTGNSKNTFTIYHLMGQHSQYKLRYPESFAHFNKDNYSQIKGLSETGAEVMSEYDNATLYNDFTLHTIIDMLRDKIAILIYAPDHGEEAYDYREVGCRENNSPITSVRLYYEVPVIIWMSKHFREKYPEKVSALRSNMHKAIYNSDLPHTILDIAGIRTATFNPEVSLLRNGAGRTNRHVMWHNIDYDAMHDEIYRQKLRYEK